MRVLWISHFLPYPPKGGVLQRGYHLTRELAKHADVDVVAFNQPNLLEPLMPNCADARAAAISELSKFYRVVGVEDVPITGRAWGRHMIALKSLVSRYPYNINWLRTRSFSALLTDALQRSRYDIVHFDTIGLAVYYDVVKRLSGSAALSLGHHNIESHMLLRRAENTSNWLSRLYFHQEGVRLAAFERRLCPKFELNIVCSDLDGQRLTKLTGVSRVVNIPNGVDVEFFKSDGAVRDPRKLLFVGTMNWYPNADAMRFFLGSVWPLLVDREPGMSIDVIGANPPADLVAYGSRDPRIRVHGFVDDVRPYLAQAGIYVCPIRDGGGTKLKVLDAFASGVPMVAHPIACEGIAAEHGRHVIFAEDAATYANSVLALLNDAALRERLAREARALVEAQYTFESIGRRLHEEFAALAPRSPTAAG